MTQVPPNLQNIPRFIQAPASIFLWRWPTIKLTRPCYENLPQELVALRQFIVWKYGLDDAGKPTKHPYTPHATKRKAKSNDPKTWNTFEKALAAADGFNGLGFVLTAEDPWTVIDLDHCRNKVNGVIEPWAQEIILKLNSYTEISPSGEGVHIWTRGKVVDTKRKKGKVEIFFSGFYLTMTGHHLGGTPTTIEPRQNALEALHKEVFGKPQAAPQPQAPSKAPSGANGLTDFALIDKALAAANGHKFELLWKGDTSAHGGDDSSADFDLCSRLAWWTGGDPGRIDRLFRQSGLMRKKWDRPTAGSTYGAMTINKALAGMTEFYSPGHGVGQGAGGWGPATGGAWPEPKKEAAPWPEMASQAFHGLAGEFVRLVEPHTESDPVALLGQFLCGVGNMIGRGAYCVAEADRHHANLDMVNVGATAKGRKGVSLGHVRRTLEMVDSKWGALIKSGLSSGEGLIWQVRNPIIKIVPKKDRSTGETNYVEEIVDSGVDDKRLLVVESEFATVLRQLSREGNILSSVIRDSWDRGDLSTLPKNSPAKASGAHISIIGHITQDELRRYLDRTEAGNGFGNRFLWFCVRRSKCLPEGGRINEVDFAPFLKRLGAVVDFAQNAGEVTRDPEARELWAQVYRDLSEGKPGMVGALTSRAEAQVLRLSMIYALLDCECFVRVPHLLAALAVWDYCDASVRYIFGQSLGAPAADAILEALKAAPSGLTRTEINNLFGRNLSADRLQAAIGALVRLGLIRIDKSETGGRPTERFFHKG